MILRNGVIVVILDPTLQIFKYYVIPLAILVLGATFRMIRESRRTETLDEGQIEAALGSPFEFGAAIRFALVFTGVSLLSLFLQEVYSDSGVIVAALIGGFASAGAIVATVGIGFGGATIGLSTAVFAVIIATTTSVLNKVVYVYTSDREPALLRNVAKDSLIMAVGVVVFIILLAIGLVPIV